MHGPSSTVPDCEAVTGMDRLRGGGWTDRLDGGKKRDGCVAPPLTNPSFLLPLSLLSPPPPSVTSFIYGSSLSGFIPHLSVGLSFLQLPSHSFLHPPTLSLQLFASMAHFAYHWSAYMSSILSFFAIKNHASTHLAVRVNQTEGETHMTDVKDALMYVTHCESEKSSKATMYEICSEV